MVSEILVRRELRRMSQVRRGRDARATDKSRSAGQRTPTKARRVQPHWCGVVFLTGLFALALFGTVCLWYSLSVNPSNTLTALVWLLGFFVLSLNIAYMFLTALIAIICGPLAIPATEVITGMSCDLLFVVKDEPVSVFENMQRSLRANTGAGIRLVIVSNSTTPDVLEDEHRQVRFLEDEFGADRVLYWRPPFNPTGRKHCAVQQWLREGPAAEYCFICDADSIVPSGTIARLLAKAEHPDNSDIAVFQGQIRVGNCSTYFAKYLRFGAELSQRVYLVAYQRIFGCALYFGHGALLRRDAFKWLRVPASVLSHDVWDMAMLSRRGHRVAFCHDVYSYEEFPADYLESVRRDRRWAEGTLQSVPLLAMPGISFANRFFVAFAIYTYSSQLVFLLWFLLGFAMSIGSHPSLGHLTQALAPIGAGTVLLDGGSMYLPVLLVIFLHRLPFCRSFTELGNMAQELAVSTIIFLNSIVYSSLAVVLAPVGKRIWVPMRKGKGTSLELAQVMREMAPSFLLGCFLLGLGLRYSAGWVICAAPVLVALTIGPIAVWLTARPVTSPKDKTTRPVRSTSLARAIPVLAILSLLVQGTSHGQELLTNAGFEAGTGEPQNPYGIADWVGYGNQERSSELVRTGSSSLKLFGGTGNAGSYQVVPLLPGVRLHAIAHFYTPSNDAISGTARAGIRIEFLGTDPQATEWIVATGMTPTDLWHSFQTTISSPLAIGAGRFVVIWADGGAPAGSTYWDDAKISSASNPATNLLSNADFELGEGGLGNSHGIRDWVAFGNSEMTRESAFEGTASLKLFGGLAYSGLFQGFRFDPRDTLSLSIRYMTSSVDAIGGTAAAGVVVEWPGPVLEPVERIDIDQAVPRDQWLRRELIVNPPDGAIAARLVLPFEDGNSPSGAAYIDDVSLLAVIPGDTNADFRVNGLDIPMFLQALLTTGLVDYSVLAASDLSSPGDVGTPDGELTTDDLERFVELLISSQ